MSERTNEDVACDYCDRTELAYEMHSDRGPVVRCLPCLAIEQGQIRGWESFERYDEDLQQATIESNVAWMTVLARVRQDEPILQRDSDAMRSIKPSIRRSIQNLMGAEAYYSPSEIADADEGELVEPAQQTLGDGDGE